MFMELQRFLFWERKKFEAFFVQHIYITEYYKYTDSNRDSLFRIDMSIQVKV